jgi:hypothetical protein
MKPIIPRAKFFLIIFAIVSYVFVAALPSIAGKGAKLDFKKISSLKGKPIVQMSTPIVMVTVPVEIKDMASPWRNADLVVEALVMFGDQDSNIVGYAIGKRTVSNAFSSGNYQGTVKVPVKELHGDITNMSGAISVALAKKGNECKVLGLGTQSNSSADDNQGNDTTRPYSYPFLPGFLEINNF